MKKFHTCFTALFFVLAGAASHAGAASTKRLDANPESCFQLTCGKSEIGQHLVEGGADRSLQRVAEGGADRTFQRVAEGGGDRTFQRVADGALIVPSNALPKAVLIVLASVLRDGRAAATEGLGRGDLRGGQSR